MKSAAFPDALAAWVRGAVEQYVRALVHRRQGTIETTQIDNQLFLARRFFELCDSDADVFSAVREVGGILERSRPYGPALEMYLAEIAIICARRSGWPQEVGELVGIIVIHEGMAGFAGCEHLKIDHPRSDHPSGGMFDRGVKLLARLIERQYSRCRRCPLTGRKNEVLEQLLEVLPTRQTTPSKSIWSPNRAVRRQLQLQVRRTLRRVSRRLGLQWAFHFAWLLTKSASKAEPSIERAVVLETERFCQRTVRHQMPQTEDRAHDLLLVLR